MTLIPRLGAAALLFALALPGQTLDQAEQKWKARDYFGANDVFKALVSKYPDNPDYRVRWGRLMLDHGQPEDAADLFNEALEIKKDCAGAFMGLALVADENFGSSALELAQNALKFDPKLVEAQELLARLALEDNDNAKAASEARKALALDAGSVQGKAVLASMDLLADKRQPLGSPRRAWI